MPSQPAPILDTVGFTPNPTVARFGLALIILTVAACFLILITSGARGDQPVQPTPPAIAR